jgi:hypothetical protein
VNAIYGPYSVGDILNAILSRYLIEGQNRHHLLAQMHILNRYCQRLRNFGPDGPAPIRRAMIGVAKIGLAEPTVTVLFFYSSRAAFLKINGNCSGSQEKYRFSDC